MKKTLLLLSLTSLTQAAVLSGTGSNLPIGDTGPLAPGILRNTVVSGGTWTGTWTAAAQAPWVGTYTVSGVTLSGSSPAGSAEFDFTTLPTGTLPVGTFFNLGDVDEGSTALTLRA